jgi:hypothetical protein
VTLPPTPSLDQHAAPPPVTAREVLFFVLALALAVALLPLLGGSVLWTWPLWFDEICCVLYVVDDATSPLQVLRNIIIKGEDWAPPLLHLIVWTVGRLTGGITPVVLRSIALACVALAMLLVYATLRRRFGRAPAIAGALAVATHPLVVTHAFDGRFYGPWLLFAAGYAWSLGVERDNARSLRRAVAQAAFAVCLATIHWFGVLSLGLMCGAAVATHGRHWRAGLRFIAPSALGFLAIFAFVPLALEQRAAAAGLLWVPALSAAQVGVMLRLFVVSTVPILAAVILVIGALPRGDGRPAMAANVRETLRDPSLAALCSLALMPLVLILVSILLQPSMVPRYGIVTVLAWAPLMALAVATLGREARAVVALFLVMVLALNVRRIAAEKRAYTSVVAANAAAFEQAKTMNAPIVFWGMHNIYPVVGPRRSDHARARYLDLPDSTIDAMFPQPRLGWLRNNMRIDRDQARSHARAYGFPTMTPRAQLDTTQRFLLVGADEGRPRLYERVEVFTAQLFPRHRLTRLNPNLTLLQR